MKIYISGPVRGKVDYAEDFKEMIRKEDIR